jgi:lactate permease
VPGAVAIICFLETAQVMRLSGMTSELGAALAALGSGFCLTSPWLGALGGWLTGSNTGSNALFAPLQFETATQIGLSPEWLVAGQNAAGSHAAMVSPARTVLAATGAGLDQAESLLLRAVGPVVLIAEVVIMLLLCGLHLATG